MAAYDLQEQEQIANLKAFWKSWGTPIVVALLVGVTAVVGSKLWNGHKQKRAEAASDLYVGMEKAVKAGDAAKSRALALQLRSDYQNTPYAVRAAMMLAQTAIAGKDLKTAQTQLQWALDNTAEDDLKDLLRLRLAAVQLDQKQYAEALKTLENKADEAYLALFADLKGDILFAQGKTAEAAKSYEIAINKADKQSPLHQLLQFKVDALGGNK
jgi:predicted negative regulator of RcsB-dependent stress response